VRAQDLDFCHLSLTQAGASQEIIKRISIANQTPVKVFRGYLCYPVE
jgi:hypothetical protein